MAKIKNKTSNGGADEVAAILHSGRATSEQIEAWKAADKRNIPVGKVMEVIVTVGEGELAYAYMRYPDRNVLALCMRLSHQEKVLEAGEVLLQNCWIGGDLRLKPNDAMMDEYLCMTACFEAFGLVKFAPSSSAKY
jgi:hypothetical protein